MLRELNKQFSKINLLLWKKAVQHKNTPMHSKARQVTDEGNGSEITFVAEAYKSNLKDLKT